MADRASLLSSVAIPRPWGRNFLRWQPIAELRALGQSWDAIERDIMGGTKPVLWEDR